VRCARARRFPPPWSVETTDVCFIGRDPNEQALTYVYFEEEPGRRAAAKLLARDEARGSPRTSPTCQKLFRAVDNR
jgi:uracil-DNA glycosylase